MQNISVIYTDSKKKRYLLFIHMFKIIRSCALLPVCKTESLLLLDSVILLSGKHDSISEQMH